MSEQDFSQSFDAQDWAKAFCGRHPEADEGEMIGWFANAIMCGFDEAGRRAAPPESVKRWVCRGCGAKEIESHLVRITAWKDNKPSEYKHWVVRPALAGGDYWCGPVEEEV